MMVGTIVVLKSAKYPNKESVVYATLLSCDPDTEVDGVKFGNQFWKSRITFLIEENEVLVRPWHHYKTIGDAKGKTVTCLQLLLKRLMVEFSIWVYFYQLIKTKKRLYED